MQRVSLVGTISIHLRMGDSTVRVVIGIVCYLAVPVLLGTTFNDGFLKGFVYTERKIVRYNSEQVPSLVIEDTPEELQDKEKTRQRMQWSNRKITHAWCEWQGKVRCY